MRFVTDHEISSARVFVVVARHDEVVRGLCGCRRRNTVQFLETLRVNKSTAIPNVALRDVPGELHRVNG